VLSTSDSDDAVADVIASLPDVVAMFPGEHLVESIMRMDDEAPAMSVLVLDPGPEHFAALGAGARGTLPSGGSEITKAVVGIASDETVLTPEWAGLLLEAIDELDDRVRRLARLTETEREVLARRAEGETPREIADAYEVSERLVNLHVGFAVGKYHRAREAVRALDAYEAVRDAASDDSGE
jgi:DNA-binding NarL/FixJ family response regulator